jgi:hypothetical protein
VLRILQVEELTGLLVQVPGMVELQEEHAPDFVDAVLNWLRDIERCMEANRLHQVSLVASARSTLMSVASGRQPTGIEFRNRPSTGRLVSAAASQAMSDVSHITSTIVEIELDRIRAAERVAFQIVAVGQARGIFGAISDEVTTDERYSIVRIALLDDSETASGLHHLDSLVGVHDSFVLLDRALALLCNVQPLATLEAFSCSRPT